MSVEDYSGRDDEGPFQDAVTPPESQYGIEYTRLRDRVPEEAHHPSRGIALPNSKVSACTRGVNPHAACGVTQEKEDAVLLQDQFRINGPSRNS